MSLVLARAGRESGGSTSGVPRLLQQQELMGRPPGASPQPGPSTRRPLRSHVSWATGPVHLAPTGAGDRPYVEGGPEEGWVSGPR